MNNSNPRPGLTPVAIVTSLTMMNYDRVSIREQTPAQFQHYRPSIQFNGWDDWKYRLSQCPVNQIFIVYVVIILSDGLIVISSINEMVNVSLNLNYLTITSRTRANPYNAEFILYKSWRPRGLLLLEIIINVLDVSLRFIWIPRLWVNIHILILSVRWPSIVFSAMIVYRRQILTSIDDPRTGRVNKCESIVRLN